MARKQTRIPDEENTLLANVLEYAQLRHVKAMHQRPAHTANGPRTAIQGDEGFFDLTLIGDGGIILAELKRRKGAVHTEAQKAWERTARAAARHFDQARFVVALWTFDNWPHDIRAAIDTIAKPAPLERGGVTRAGEAFIAGGYVGPPPGLSGQELVPSAAPLPERPAVAPPTPPPASGAIPVQIFVDGQPFDASMPLRRTDDDTPGMRMAANLRDEIMRLRRLRNS
jgi:hypothetical protein